MPARQLVPEARPGSAYGPPGVSAAHSQRGQVDGRPLDEHAAQVLPHKLGDGQRELLLPRRPHGQQTLYAAQPARPVGVVPRRRRRRRRVRVQQLHGTQAQQDVNCTQCAGKVCLIAL